MGISIIIPTWNEAAHIEQLVIFLKKHGMDAVLEIIISDAGSTDNTLEKARNAGAVSHISPHKGRASQMNYGASLAKGDVLYFIHADTLPPQSFAADIFQAIESGSGFGRYITKYISRNLMLKINAFCTRFDTFIGYGGDQTFFITKHLFNNLNGFNESMKIMEDYDITERAKLQSKYKIIKKPVLISARKYEKNSWLRVQLANLKIVKMYKKGASQDAMASKYKELLKH